MTYCVYLLISTHKRRIFSYVGYSKNLKKRLNLHNISKGAKYTRGKKWIVFHKEIYNSKSKAMSREYELKKDKKFRNILLENFRKIRKKNISYKNRPQ
jgi:putative endonuclease|tara:strand:- start:1151 stop:1444 length:294 start_codon:yes stop_codon:yes gene_type:complete